MNTGAILLSSRHGAAVRITLPRSRSSRMVRCAQSRRSKVKWETYPAGPRITLVEGQRTIHFQVRFLFEKDTWIGDPWDIKPENRTPSRGVRRTTAVGSCKLFSGCVRSKSSLQERGLRVCRSQNVDTFFQRWDEIKHNIIVVNWVDLVDAEESLGIALLSDHTTAYTHRTSAYPLALVLGWAWGKAAFGGASIRFVARRRSATPSCPTRDAGIRFDRAGMQPLQLAVVTQLIDGHRSGSDDTFSLSNLKALGVQVSTMSRSRKDYCWFDCSMRRAVKRNRSYLLVSGRLASKLLS